jgi:hypothetical protein
MTPEELDAKFYAARYGTTRMPSPFQDPNRIY